MFGLCGLKAGENVWVHRLKHETIMLLLGLIVVNVKFTCLQIVKFSTK
jgi:hypothetical protein